MPQYTAPRADFEFFIQEFLELDNRADDEQAVEELICPAG